MCCSSDSGKTISRGWSLVPLNIASIKLQSVGCGMHVTFPPRTPIVLKPLHSSFGTIGRYVPPAGQCGALHTKTKCLFPCSGKCLFLGFQWHLCSNTAQYAARSLVALEKTTGSVLLDFPWTRTFMAVLRYRVDTCCLAWDITVSRPWHWYRDRLMP